MLKVHETIRAAGESSAVCLLLDDGVLAIAGDDGTLALPEGALDAVMARFGEPLAGLALSRTGCGAAADTFRRRRGLQGSLLSFAPRVSESCRRASASPTIAASRGTMGRWHTAPRNVGCSAIPAL
ncbi:MAG: hypothetical protein ACREJ3_17150 [Polyangiaceae bacterium]